MTPATWQFALLVYAAVGLAVASNYHAMIEHIVERRGRKDDLTSSQAFFIYTFMVASFGIIWPLIVLARIVFMVENAAEAAGEDED